MEFGIKLEFLCVVIRICMKLNGFVHLNTLSPVGSTVCSGSGSIALFLHIVSASHCFITITKCQLKEG